MFRKNDFFSKRMLATLMFFGSITQQYFQKCKLAWGFILFFFRKMAKKHNENRNFRQPVARIASKMRTIKNVYKNTWAYTLTSFVFVDYKL